MSKIPESYLRKYSLCCKDKNKAIKRKTTRTKICFWTQLFIWKKTMKKYLDILIFSLLFFLLFSYFSGNNVENTVATGVDFTISDNKYTVPAEVVLTVENNTRENLVLNSCEDITLRFKWDLIKIPEDICDSSELIPGDIATLDFSGYYTLFETPGAYVFEYKTWEKEFQQSFDVKYRGTLGKVFIGVFYAPIYNLLAYLIHIFNNSLGFAIIVMTIIVRILLLFPQHKMLVSQRKMQAIQPKIKKLQEKYKGNQQQIWTELMKLYKQEGVNPMGSCGLLLIQMPFLLVIYNIILNITSLKNEFYLYDVLPEFHISQIVYNFFGMNLLESWGVVGLCLAFSVAAIQYIQIRLSLMNKPKVESKDSVVLEKKKWADDYNSMMPDPEMMNKFMLYGMPAMVWVFTFSLVAWVGIYWWVSTLFAVFQQLFVNKIIKK